MKLYVRERGSASVRALADEANAIATSVVAYAEARAAFARLRCERPVSRRSHLERVRQLDQDWDRYAVVELTAAVARSAGARAEPRGLRGFDAIHLANALWLQSAQADDVTFAAFDRVLTTGAKAAGLTIR